MHNYYPKPKYNEAPILTTDTPSPTVSADASLLEQLIITELDDSKAEDISIIDLRGKSSFAEKMVIASGRSQRHVVSVAQRVAQKLKENGLPLLSIEGQESGNWVLLDAGDVVVHVFRPEFRELYNLERMWSVQATQPQPEHAF